MNDVAHVLLPNRTRSFHSLSVIAAVLWGCLLLALSLPAFAQAPVVSNVFAQQRPGTGLVDITYDVTSTKATVAISLRVSSDGGATFAVPVTSLTGAVGTGVAVGNGKRITWNAGADWPEKWSDAMRFEVTADDGVLAPTITAQPASQTIASGSTATLTVNASGSSPLTYQWYQGAVGTTTTPVGTNSASFITPTLSATTTYWVRVSNSAGSVNSTLATVTVASSTAAELALIPAGTFQMGVTSGDTDSDAKPFSVTITYPYYMGKKEVTKAEWDEVRTWAAANGYTDLATGDGKAANHPVQTVSWWDAIKWCNARSEKEGLTACYTFNGAVVKTGTSINSGVDWRANGYRLPTEAEWEKAARGGVSGKRFPWGTDTISHSQANFWNNGGESYQSGTTGYHPTYATDPFPYTSPVGSFAANGYGLHDMAGNVWEWCWDWYEASYYKGTDPLGAIQGVYRVKRGGSWSDYYASNCRAAHRSRNTPSTLTEVNGFRIVRSSVP